MGKPTASPKNPMHRDPTQPAATRIVPVGATAAAEALLLEALRKGDEGAFATLVERHHSSLLRLARVYISNAAVAEEVVQETWLGVLHGLERFEGRSSLKTWIFRILMNRARTRAEREERSVPFSEAWDASAEPAEPAVEPERFRGPDDPYPGHWAVPLREWDQTPEQILLSSETRKHIQEAIAALPPSQREVITLRDIEQWTSGEVCNVLGISETNQRVLLHRARSSVRRALEQYFDGGKARNANGLQRNGLQGAGGSHHRLPRRRAASPGNGAV